LALVVAFALLLAAVPAPPAAGHHLVDVPGRISVKVRVVLGDGFGRIAKAQVPQLIGKWIWPALRDGDVDTATATGTRAMLDLMVRFHRPTRDDDGGGGINEQTVEPRPPEDLPPPADTDLWHALLVPLGLVAPLFLLLLGGAVVYALARKR
jgi:hypothetical protein